MLGLWSGRLGHGMMELEPALAETMQSVGGRIPAASLTTPVVVVQFPDIWGRNVSPFGLKLEAWLRLADIPYTVEPSTDLGKGPKGKLPYIRDDGRLIGDTTLIIEHLKAPGASTRCRAVAARARRSAGNAAAVRGALLLRPGLQPLDRRCRLGRPWRPAFFGRLPFPVGRVAAGHFRRRVRRMLHMQGIGRHRPDEIYAMARHDLEAVADYLGDRPFLMGEQLTTIDAVAYAFIANVLYVPFETELKRMTQDFPTLVAYCEAMEQGLQARELSSAARDEADRLARASSACATGIRGDRPRRPPGRQRHEHIGLYEPAQRRKPEIERAQRLVEVLGGAAGHLGGVARTKVHRPSRPRPAVGQHRSRWRHS